jgi:hypothetical protein
MKLMDLLDEETVKKIRYLRRQMGTVTAPEAARKVVAQGTADGFGLKRIDRAAEAIMAELSGE